MQINSSATASVPVEADMARVVLRSIGRGETLEAARAALAPGIVALQEVLLVIGGTVIDRSTTAREDSPKVEERKFLAQFSATVEVPAGEVSIVVRSVSARPEVGIERLTWIVSADNPVRPAAYRAAVAALVAKAELTASCFGLSAVVPSMISDRPIEATTGSDGAMLGRAGSFGGVEAETITVDPPTLTVSATVYGLFTASSVAA